ncbi:response regulator [Desulfosporosinus sp. FKA]|uniref:response regulator n=1 Tax=Desulfosporosinus sp. FKA TaxID=1969834 RepID=UPI000B4A0704|nr:response regulator [Desulfosporosinus sp. FKA]
MRYFIVDDDIAFRAMLTEIIEEDLANEIVGEARDGSEINAKLLETKKVDILILDLLMPHLDGIQTARSLQEVFNGKIIMISQCDFKEMIGEAYTCGIEYYITKPLNRNEVMSVLKKVSERILVDQSIQHIKKTLSNLNDNFANPLYSPYQVKSINDSGRFLLSELGIGGESGGQDLLSILKYLYEHEKIAGNEYTFPSLKEIFSNAGKQKLGLKNDPVTLQKEIKATEQRVRRSIYHALVHIASLGLTDYSNPKFEEYASKYFDFDQIRKKMLELKNGQDSGQSHARINSKKFIQVFYWDAKKLNT